MNPFAFSIYACGVCGVVMVCGSIWLLKKGVIKLSEAVEGAEGLTVELLDKVKISTTYPALALFLIGLLFIGVGVWFSKTPPPLNIVGKFDIDDPSIITVSVVPDTPQVFTVDSNGRLDNFLPIDIQRLRLVINAAGYKPLNAPGDGTRPKIVTLRVEDAKWQRLTLKDDDLKFTRTASAMTPAPGATPAAGVALEPFHQP